MDEPTTEKPIIPVRDNLPEEPLQAELPFVEEASFKEEKRMTLGEHIEELRSRLVICIVAFFIIFAGSMIFYHEMWYAVLLPLKRAAAASGKNWQSLVIFQWESPMAALLTLARIGLILTIVITIPLTARQIWGFVSPGLRTNEKRGISIVFGIGSLLFLAGATFAYMFACPTGLQWLLWFNSTLEGSQNIFTGVKYTNFLIMVCVGFGIGFETPLVMMALAKIKLITPEGIIKYWRQAVLTIVILGAIFTPPDPITQIMLATVMTILFFVGYFLTRLVSK